MSAPASDDPRWLPDDYAIRLMRDRTLTSKVLCRALQTLITGAILTLTACSTPPLVQPEPIALETVAVLPVTTLSDSALPPRPASLTANPSGATDEAGAQVGASPPPRSLDYSDLFDRIRAGFKLPDSD